MTDPFERIPYSYEELHKRFPTKAFDLPPLSSIPDYARPIAPLNIEECDTIRDGIMDIAAKRALSEEECFIFGQLNAAYTQAVRADTLGHTGSRYLVVELDSLSQGLRDKWHIP